MSNAADSQNDYLRSEDSDDEDEQQRVEEPAGPIYPPKCTAAGAGVSGGSAGETVSFVVTAKDASGRRIFQGGAILSARVSSKDAPSEAVKATVRDQGDGTYAVSYVVPRRGDYSVSVECNGVPIMGSPFPVFFSGAAAAGTGGSGQQSSLPVAPTPAPPLIPTPPAVNPMLPQFLAQAAALRGILPGMQGIPGMHGIPGLQGPYPGMVGGVMQGSGK